MDGFVFTVNAKPHQRVVGGKRGYDVYVDVRAQGETTLVSFDGYDLPGTTPLHFLVYDELDVVNFAGVTLLHEEVRHVGGGTARQGVCRVPMMKTTMAKIAFWLGDEVVLQPAREMAVKEQSTTED